MLLPSANDIAALLAVHDAGGLGAFVARMNSMAREARGGLDDLYRPERLRRQGTDVHRR